MTHPFNRKTLVVIGAGPKGIAVAVKAKVLEEFGCPVDRVILIEKNEIAAHWTGEFGYTNGEIKLGTSPEKDVVFPIETDVGDTELSQKIQQRLLQFTWTSFLVQTQQFSAWVDRGRPSPSHQMWASYLKWVSALLKPQITIIKAEVVSIDITPDKNHWSLGLNPMQEGKFNSQQNQLIADRLMLTGPGKPVMNFLHTKQNLQVRSQEIYDLETFWDAITTKKFKPLKKIAIVGAGENAASVLLALAKYAPCLQADIICPKGFIATRSENYYENQFFTHPDKNSWSALKISDRIDFIQRTDLGVFSVLAMTILNETIRHQIVPGRVLELKEIGSVLALKLEYHHQSFSREYDQVILATGFDQVSSLQSIFTPSALNALENAVGAPLLQNNLALKIQSDLSVEGMFPILHLPMLAGLMQGPGFANLSCLGALSDRVVTNKMNQSEKKTHNQITPLLFHYEEEYL